MKSKATRLPTSNLSILILIDQHQYYYQNYQNATVRAIIKPIHTLASQALHNRQSQGILMASVQDCNGYK